MKRASIYMMIGSPFAIAGVIYLTEYGWFANMPVAIPLLVTLLAFASLFLSFAFFYMHSSRRKKAMIVLGVIGLLITMLGYIFKLQHWPGANVQTIVGVLIICFSYSPLRFYEKYLRWKGLSLSHRDALYLSISELLGSVFFFLGILFKFMHWPYANFMMTSGALVLGASVLGWNRKFKQEVVQRKQMQDDLHSANDLLAEKNKEITDSINYAKKIQDAYLPPMRVFEHYFQEGFILFQPKDIVSGDFYWFFKEGFAENKASDWVYLAVADCTGHGVPGAIMSVICCNALNDVAVTRAIQSPEKILDETRQLVVRTLKSENGSGRQDGMDISLCRFNYKSGELQFAGAHNPAIVVKAGGAEVIELGADKQPIGFFERAFPFTLREYQLQKGDTLYLFTDGYADQFGGPKGKKLKFANLQKLLQSMHNIPMQQQKQQLTDAFENWRGNLEQIDDVCVIGVRL